MQFQSLHKIECTKNYCVVDLNYGCGKVWQGPISQSTRSPFVTLLSRRAQSVGDPLSGNGCGSPNHIVSIISFLLVLFTQFILDKKIMGRYIQ